MPWLRFFVAAPPAAVRPMLLIRRQARHPVARQDPMDRGGLDRDLMKACQIGRDAPRAKMIVLSQVQNLADDLRRRRARRDMGRPGAIAQPGLAALVETSFPLVERLARDAEMPTSARDVAVGGGPTQQAPSPSH